MYHVLAGAPSQGSGLALWADLPELVQRKVLASPALSLRELARLATTCKLFHEACLELYEAELTWLAESATSSFGHDMVGAALRFFRRQRDVPGNEVAPGHQEFDITGGGKLPHDSQLFSEREVTVIAPAQGLLGEGQEATTARWGFYTGILYTQDIICTGYCPPRLCAMLRVGGVFRAEDTRLGPQFRIRVKFPSQSVPCLGLLHLVLKDAWEHKVREATEPAEAHRKGWQPALGFEILGCQKPRRLTWNHVPMVPEDAQRASFALHMWAWRAWGSAPLLSW